MNEKSQIWQSWADFLHRWGVKEIVASLLEAGGLLNLLAAQAVYLGQPLLGTLIAPAQLNTLASMLESETETLSFVNYLREAGDRESQRIGS